MKKLFPILLTALFLSGCSLSPSAPITGTEEQKAEKLAQIIERGGQADCKVTNLSDNSVVQILISGKKIKMTGSDFGEGKQGTMLNDGVYTYMWSEGASEGYKTKIETENLTPTPVGQETGQVDTVKQTEGYDDETKYRTDCVRRIIADSEFLPPSNIKFIDPLELMKGY